MLFSRIVARDVLKAFEKARKIVMESTAIGIDAETVMPTLRNRYKEDAPNTMPRTEPRSTAERVSSAGTFRGGNVRTKARRGFGHRAGSR